MLKKSVGLVLVLVTTYAILQMLHSPRHWLRKVSLSAVKVDECPVSADLYMGQRDQEDSHVLGLLHVEGMGDYLLDFEASEYREAVDYESIRLRERAWSFRPVRVRPTFEDSSLNNANDLRFRSSSGHTITIQL